MKRLATYSFVLILLIISGVSVYAQVRVTGHVVAEVVEVASAASNVNNRFSIIPGQNTSGIDLGEITLSGGSLVASAVLISSNNLIGEFGNQVEFEASSYHENVSYMPDASGLQRFRLTGSAGKNITEFEDKKYTSHYVVVFAYN
ncbi:MAG: hypothetical protein U1C46_03300 [Bacteroidales bacterium]|nr:hypothetical protein [Bacteroidales bacterium]MDZ4203826.1 hypothetical protein [Bacteroidales bacterium]